MSAWARTTVGAVMPFRYGKGLPERARSHTGKFRVVSSAGFIDSHDHALTHGATVVVGRKGSIGTVYYCPEPVFPIDTTFYVEGSDQIDSRFAFYLLSSLPLRQMNNDSAVPGLNRTHAENLEILLPPIGDQRAIAATLGVLDDKIESNRRAVDIAENLGDQLFATAVDGAAALADVAKLTMGSSPPGDSYNEFGDGLPFYQGIRDFGRRYPGHRVWTTNAIRLAQEGDSLVSVRAPVGELNRSLETCCIGRGVAAVRSTHPSTVFYALRAADSLWEPFQHEGTVFGAINKSDLSSARLPWPRAAALASLEGTLSVIDSKIRSLSLESEHLANLRDSLLPVLLSGRVRAPAIREVVQEVTT